jgi:serine-type D-Ala-D-Ala carboxypeptidase (penicillin-binding protein 5/6)
VACVVVADSGRVLWARDVGEPRPNASTTKLATALVVLDHVSLAETVVVSAAAAATGGGGLDLQRGESYSVEDLLYALLLTSSNDAAVALAEHTAGSEPAFVALMNEKAERLGLRGTSFVTSHGLDAPGHESTARDLATLGFEVIEDPMLAPIVATGETTIAGRGGELLLENRNPLLETYRGAVGVKTGYTADAGNVLVAAARRHDRTVVAVAMGALDAAADARALLDLGFARLARTLLVPAGKLVGAVTLDPAGSVPVISAGAFRGIYRPDAVAAEFEADPHLSTPVEPGEHVGTIIVSFDGRPVATIAAVAGGELGSSPGSPIADALAGLLAMAGRVWPG